jgi:hypothetical protein
MRILNEEEADKSLNRENNLAHKINRIREVRELDRTEISKDHIPGRDQGTPNVPEFLRPVIAAEARICKHQEVADAYGIGKSTVDHYATGRIGGSKEAGERAGLKQDTDKRLEPIRSRALDLTMKALGLVENNEDLPNCKPEVLMNIASQASRIHQNLSPKENPLDQDRTQLIVYAPNLKKIADYEVIDA